jgi:hypothetical protein
MVSGYLVPSFPSSDVTPGDALGLNNVEKDDQQALTNNMYDPSKIILLIRFNESRIGCSIKLKIRAA